MITTSSGERYDSLEHFIGDSPSSYIDDGEEQIAMNDNGPAIKMDLPITGLEKPPKPANDNDSRKPYQLSMNLENLPTSGKIEYDSPAQNLRQNLQNSMPRSNIPGEGVVLKDTPLNKDVGKAMSGIHDQMEERAGKSLQRSKRMIDWVHGDYQIPGTSDLDVPTDRQLDEDYAQPVEKK